MGGARPSARLLSLAVGGWQRKPQRLPPRMRPLLRWQLQRPPGRPSSRQSWQSHPRPRRQRHRGLRWKRPGLTPQIPRQHGDCGCRGSGSARPVSSGRRASCRRLVPEGRRDIPVGLTRRRRRLLHSLEHTPARSQPVEIPTEIEAVHFVHVLVLLDRDSVMKLRAGFHHAATTQTGARSVAASSIGVRGCRVLRSVTLSLALSVLAAACALVEPPVPAGTFMVPGEVRNMRRPGGAHGEDASRRAPRRGAASVPAGGSVDCGRYVSPADRRGWSIAVNGDACSSRVPTSARIRQGCTLGIELAERGRVVGPRLQRLALGRRDTRWFGTQRPRTISRLAGPRTRHRTTEPRSRQPSSSLWVSRLDSAGQGPRSPRLARTHNRRWPIRPRWLRRCASFRPHLRFGSSHPKSGA